MSTRLFRSTFLFLFCTCFLLPVHAQQTRATPKPVSKASTAAVKPKSTTTTAKPATAKPKSTPKPTPRPQLPKPPTWSGGEPQITARAAVLFDANTGKILYAKNRDMQMPVASTQKLLTALVVCDAGNLDRRVTITEADTQVAPTKLPLRRGETFTRRQLIDILLVKSCNDVAAALARDNAGSIEAFSTRMNVRAERTGARSSHFINPHGLPDPLQYSTARDMACIARAAYANPVLRRSMATRTLVVPRGEGRTVTLKNTNRVLHSYSFCNGMKTGYTIAAGRCLISSASLNGRDVIAVVLGAQKHTVWHESLYLLAYGLDIPPERLSTYRVAPLNIGEE